MNIKLIAALLVGGLFVAVPAHALDEPAPAPIFGLIAEPGPALGSVKLRWAAVQDDTPSEPATRYIVKYRFFNLITSTPEWSAAFRIDDPPVNVTPPTPSSPTVQESLLVTGLQPGVVYGFQVRAFDQGDNLSELVAGASAQATAPCGANANDGLGVSSMTIAPAIIPGGAPTMSTITVTIGGAGISTGGRIVLKIPDGLSPPTTYTPPGNNGYITQGFTSFSASSGPALYLSIDGRNAVLTASSPVSPGAVIKFYYYTLSCQAGPKVFVTATQFSGCGTLINTIFSATSIVGPGTPRFIDPGVFNITTVLNQITAVPLRVVDQCGNTVGSPGSQTIPVSAVRLDGNGNPGTDPNAQVSLSASFTSPASMVSVPFMNGQQTAVVYYKINSAASAPNNKLALQQTDFVYGGSWNRFIDVTPLSTGISASSVDSGIPVTGQKTVSFSPDNDGIADTAAVNFTIPSLASWMIELSSTDFITVARRFYGNAVNARVIWDGYTDGVAGTAPQIAEPALYAVRISLNGSVIVDNSLTITLVSNGVQGIVKDDANVVLKDVDIEIFGPSQRFGRSAEDGKFTVYGLKAGAYQIRYRKPGYGTKEISTTITSGLKALNVANLQKQSVLRLTVTRPQADVLEEVWGQVRANDSTWNKQAWGTVHFGRGKDIADAGDLFNAVPTPYTDLTLEPSVSYRVAFQVPNLSVPDITNYTIIAGTVVPMTVSLTPRANIEGLVALPPGTNGTGSWVSVEAGPDNNLDLIFDNQDPAKRYWGGAWIPAGESSATYRIFGVNNGSYLVVASAPNYIPQKVSAIVSGNMNTLANFPPLSTGGVATIGVTVTGDSAGLDGNDGNNDGFFPLSLNVYSSSLQIGSYRQIQVPTNATTTSGSVQMTGLSDGVYDVYANLIGFELDPPGRRVVNVVGGTGNLSLTYKPFSGGISGAITLPGGQTNFNTVQITARAYDWNVGSVSSPQFSGNSYSFSRLGTGFYELTARYPTTGYIIKKNVQVVNGLVANAALDLSGNTFTISGRVTSNARSPYNTLGYLVNSSSPTNLYDDVNSNSTPVTHVANRVMATLIQRNNNEGPGTVADRSHFNSRETFFGDYDANGDYAIPNLTPGIYRLRTNGEIDNNFNNGLELSEAPIVVKIFTANVTNADITISDGYNVSGTIRVVDGSATSRPITLMLKNAAGETVASQYLVISNSAATFQLERLPAGDYILSASDNGFPRAYAAKDVRVVVDNSDLSNVQIDLMKAVEIRGRLRIKTSGILLTSKNYDQFLSSDFRVEARANPWFNGGYGQSDTPLINAEGYFTIPANPGKYDLLFYSYQGLSPQDITQGKKQFVPLRLSGIEVAAGQTYDLGTIEMIEGTTVKGKVRDKAGNPVPNVIVIAQPSGEKHDFDPIQTITNELGDYTIQGVDSVGKRFYDITAAPRSDDERFAGYTGTQYGEVRRTQVDTRLTTPLDFVIEPALGVVRGRVVTGDGGDLETPFEHDQQAGAEIIMNKVGNIPQDNPLGNIEQSSLADGTFEIRGLSAGTYTLWALAKGYANGLVRNVTVGNGVTDVGDVTVGTGFTLTGTITRPDGTAPGDADIDTLLAVRGGFEEVLIGQLVKDAAGTINSYSITGFQTGRPYTILTFDDSDEIKILGEGLVMENDTTRNFTLIDRQPSVFARATKTPEGTLVIQFEFTKALRNSVVDLDGLNGPDDSEGPRIIALTTGTGEITYPIDFLAGDRKRARVVYTPAAGESRFTITVNANFETVDSATGLNHTASKNFSFFLGIGKQKEQKFTNAGGGVVQLDEDTSEFSAQPGTFGTDADDEVPLVFRVADNASDFSGAASSPLASRAMKVAAKLGLKAYPPEMASAIHKIKGNAVDPFSSFYDIFLPAGVNHFFPEGREARLCVAYDAGVADPFALNVYYFNPTTDEFLLEAENKTVDTDNLRICVSLGHASVFTVLNSSAAVISGAGYTGELAVMNFPNPFNLNSKTVSLQNPGAAAASQNIQGTMIKVSVPGDIAGGLEIEIFSVSGERVRTLRDNIPVGGAHYYLEWDGKNDAGAKVASGTYVARMTISGGNEKFFKMAVVK